MRARTYFFLSLICLMACLVALPAWAQEGHPLTGSWHGEWHPAPGQKTPILLYMKWNTKEVEGMINPGPNSMPFKVVTLDPDKWTVHIEADGKDAAGKPVHVVLDGKLENIGSYNRTITGTWTQGTTKGDFKATRD
jgi:hypothetical protein